MVAPSAMDASVTAVDHSTANATTNSVPTSNNHHHHPDDEPEVMQVFSRANNAKKHANGGRGGTPTNPEEGSPPLPERPMSWEGGLSDNDDDDEGQMVVDDGPLPLITSKAPPSTPQPTPMPAVEATSGATPAAFIANAASFASLYNAAENRLSPKQQASLGPSRPPLAPSPQFPPRPTSSSSSRSSCYSPTQSPLLPRGGVIFCAPGGQQQQQTHLLPSHLSQQMHHRGSDGSSSVYSPTSSPLQSPGEGRRGMRGAGGMSDGVSPTTTSHLRNLSVRSAPGSAGNSSSARTTPDHVVVMPNGVNNNGSLLVTNNNGGSMSVTELSLIPQAVISSTASSASDESNPPTDYASSSPSRRSSDPLSTGSASFSLDSAASAILDPASSAFLAGTAAGVSRQQLLSGPCPICGDRISGFHYGIFSCESCKGFFKRTVQNKKNYVCLRGSNCTVQITTRKKCPACRFDKCLKMGMKLEAIREDRTRGGRSTYQCTYALPPSMLTPPSSTPLLQPGSSPQHPGSREEPDRGGDNMQPQAEPMALLQKATSSASTAMTVISSSQQQHHHHGGSSNSVSMLSSSTVTTSATQSRHHHHHHRSSSSHHHHHHHHRTASSHQSGASGGPLSTLNGHLSLEPLSPAATPQHAHQPPPVPQLIQEIVSVEHLWHYTDREMHRISESMQQQQQSVKQEPDDASLTADSSAYLFGSLCNIADHRLYKIVKWCKSLPLFRDITVDDQIALLINSWCELLLLSCCYRSIATPHEIRVSMGKSVTLCQAQSIGMGPVIERMLNLTDLLRRLSVDQCEFVCLKVIILLTSDASGLKEPEKVRLCKKQVLEALQQYTILHYPQCPAKFGELLLCIPELERACQISKESLAASKQQLMARQQEQRENGGDGGGAGGGGDATASPGFNLLMELLRGDH